MNPYLATALIVAGFLLNVAAGCYIGSRVGYRLWSMRRRGIKTRFARIATHYAPWGTLCGVLICVMLFITQNHPLLGLLSFGPFCATLMIADSLEPDPKRCSTCGHES